MKLGQFEMEGTEETWTGVVLDDDIVHLNEAGSSTGIDLPRELQTLFRTWNWKEKVNLTVSYAQETGAGVYAHTEVEQVTPITDPQKVIAVGLNYSEHAEEGNMRSQIRRFCSLSSPSRSSGQTPSSNGIPS